MEDAHVALVQALFSYWFSIIYLRVGNSQRFLCCCAVTSGSSLTGHDAFTQFPYFVSYQYQLHQHFACVTLASTISVSQVTSCMKCWGYSHIHRSVTREPPEEGFEQCGWTRS